MWKAAAAVLGLLSLLAAAYGLGRLNGRDSAKDAAHKASDTIRERVVVQAAKVETRIVERERTIRVATKGAVETIKAAPEADTPIPPAVRSAWLAGLGSVRDAGSDPDPGSGSPAN